MANRIVLKGEGRYDEAPASAALSPGHLIERISTGKVRKHATAGGVSLRMFAIEDSLIGKTIDDAYAADDIVRHVIASPGDVVYAILKAGQSVVIGDDLVSNGDGTLIKRVPATHTDMTSIVAKADETLDATALGDTHMQVQVR
jgi:hypothetical protein